MGQVPELSGKQNCLGVYSRRDLVLSSARSRDCNDLALSFHSKPLAGSLGGLPDFLIGIIDADDGEEAVATAEPVISLQTFAFIKYAGIKYFSCFGFRSPYDEIRRSPKDNGVLNLIKTGFKL